MGDARPDREEGPVVDDRLSEQATLLHDQTGRERDVLAQRRDGSSTLRDQIADGRDREATSLDAREDLADRHTLRVEELRGRGRASRRRAADDRARAGGDREHAGGDREDAAFDRAEAAYDRDQAGTDELTGARRRRVGLEELENEIKRARREGHSLVGAYVDVDGLKAVNDGEGHAVGDMLLRTVAEGFRRQMRSYDLLVRLGGDEFLCVLPSIPLVAVQERFAGLHAELKDAVGTSVSIGYSELRDGDSEGEFVSRADAALLAYRRE